MAQIDGDLAVLDTPFPYTVYNKLLTNWRGAVAPTGALPGLIWSKNDEKLFHTTVAGENQIAQGEIMPVADGVRLSEPGAGADYMDFLLDGTDAFIKWSDGKLILQTDEGTDTDTVIEIKPKGTAETSALYLFDTDDWRLFLYTLADTAIIRSKAVALSFQYNTAQDIKCWEAIAAGNPDFYIYGFKTADAVKYLRMYVHTDGTPHFDAEVAPITFDDNILVSGNIAVTGTVDGVDVAALKTDVDGFQDELKDLTQVEIQQLENIAATTISAAQWGYLGACGAGGGQLLAGLTAAESTQLEAIGAATISAAQWGYLGACGAGGGQLMANITAGESTQIEAIGAVTINVTQWGYLGALDQGLTQASSPTFDDLTISTPSNIYALNADSFVLSCACRAYLTNDQLMDNGVIEKILFDAENYDVGGDFDADGVDSNFTAPSAGYYYIYAQAWAAAGWADGDSMQIYIYVQGASVAYTKDRMHGANYTQSVSVSSTEYLSAADVVDIRFMANSAADESIDGGTTMTFVCIHKLGV